MILSSGTVPELSWQFIVGVVVLTTVMVAITRRRIMRRSINPRATARQRASETHQKNSAESDLRDLLLDLEKAAREITAQIDTRYRKLELGMREADSRIAELRRLGGSGPAARPSPPKDSRERLDITVGDDEIDAPIAIAPPTPAAAVPAVRTSDFARIGALADQRLPARDIAARVQRTVGEVELMLAMRRKGLAKDVPESADQPD